MQKNTNLYLARNLRRIRNEKKISMEEIASKMNTSPTTISRIELEQANPTIKTLENLAAALDVTIEELLKK